MIAIKLYATFAQYLIINEQPDKTGCYWNMEKLRDDAPEEAVKAFERYKEALKRARESVYDEFDRIEF